MEPRIKIIGQTDTGKQFIISPERQSAIKKWISSEPENIMKIFKIFQQELFHKYWRGVATESSITNALIL